ncbi:MAG TPA: YdjY domain-containing protein [Tepidisphaeraceae bacterium]|nr:YdjY domain-containing protein [Tepidisphaeraceae bacterium]
MRARLCFLLPLLCIAAIAPAAPTTAPVGKLPHIEVDVQQKQVHVECEAVRADYPLEFLAVVRNGNEYESIVRSDAKPSDVHLALLMLGLKPGEPVHYSESTKTWLPPSGPPIVIWFEYDKDGKHEKIPATRWMRDVRSKREPPAFSWVFTGSKTMADGTYAADPTGYLISVINNELSVLDVPDLKARALEARELERNPDTMPPTGTPVTMILSPAGADNAAPPPQQATSPATTQASLSDVHIDQQKVDRLRERWQQAVAPHRGALKEAAQAHYEVINELRREQQRLIDEADRIQRTIDQLEKEYQDMTTPRPEAAP